MHICTDIRVSFFYFISTRRVRNFPTTLKKKITRRTRKRGHRLLTWTQPAGYQQKKCFVFSCLDFSRETLLCVVQARLFCQNGIVYGLSQAEHTCEYKGKTTKRQSTRPVVCNSKQKNRHCSLLGKDFSASLKTTFSLSLPILSSQDKPL